MMLGPASLTMQSSGAIAKRSRNFSLYHTGEIPILVIFYYPNRSLVEENIPAKNCKIIISVFRNSVVYLYIYGVCVKLSYYYHSYMNQCLL
jgi:hypothetical protein